MGMPISSVGSGANLAPALELPQMQVRSAEIRAAAAEFAASLPGNGGHIDAHQQNIRRIAEDIAHVSQTFNKKLQFVVDQRSNEVIVKVIDRETDKVIKVLPPEELQRLHRKLKETIGVLFNERV